ncbi:MAG TPA: DUF6221 family protein [Jatrophihabitantaceae bacterium]|jgi:hypothetical protein
MDDGLVRFLLARIADDERDLRRINGAGAGDGVLSSARAMAECAAKRDVIGIMQRMLVLRDLPLERQVRDGATEVLRRMAAVYGSHVGYRTDWRPKPGRVLT